MHEKDEISQPCELAEYFNSLHYTSEIAEISSTFQCPECQNNSLEVAPGTPPHAASLRCGGCGQFVRWIEKSDNAKRREAENALINELLGSTHLNHWQQTYLRSILQTKKRSPRQREKLQQILKQVEEKGGGGRSPPEGE